jgi:pimeloyl-ACP methyl ester carboxylesterase
MTFDDDSWLNDNAPVRPRISSRRTAIRRKIAAAMAELVVQSADGTRISSQSYGEGRPLIVVSGALFASELWQRVVPLLCAERAVYVVDRRGRGKSGNAAAYAPEREIEDLLAVLAALPGPVD